MEVILLERVEKLGQIGDVVTVKNGFARNFLLPRNKALRSNAANLKIFEANKAKIVADNDAKRSEAEKAAKTVEGIPVHPGIYEGTVRIVNGPPDFDRLQQGDVLVARNTGPAFNVVLPLLGAIVTDRGGQLSHAAIVAREYGIPAVVGTREATTTFPDGARVRVNGDKGLVELLS